MDKLDALIDIERYQPINLGCRNLLYKLFDWYIRDTT